MSPKVEADNLVSLRQRNCDIRLVLIGRHHLCHSGTSSASVSGAVRPQWRRGPTFSSTARIRADMACICTFSGSIVRSKLVHHAKRKSIFSSLVIAAHCLPAAGAAIAASHVLPAAGPPAVTIRLPFRDRAKAVTLICREAVEQPHAAGALKPILATIARGM